MSLILDALRKLDREKSSRRKGVPNIASEILRPDSSREREKVLRYVIAFSLTAVVAAGLTYAVVAGIGMKGKPLPPEAPASAGLNQPAATVPADSGSAPQPPALSPVSPPVLKKQAAVQPPAAAPARPSPPVTVSSPEPPKTTEPVPRTAAAAAKPSPPASLSPPAPPQQAAPVSPPVEPAREARGEPPRSPARAAETAASAPQQAETSRGDARKPGGQASEEGSSSPPPLKITGIVWNEDPASRRAVINGAFLKEGSVIEGVKVVEILPTQVRFQYKDQTFQITVF